nr:MAG TPA: hypothetical protein [Caudoviricetes sp.]
MNIANRVNCWNAKQHNSVITWHLHLQTVWSKYSRIKNKETWFQ